MNKDKIAVIGLGYVGLPLASLFATKYDVVGFDINQKRIDELSKGYDSTLEITTETLSSVLKKSSNDNLGLLCTSLIEDIKSCNYYIVTVPTPIDINNKPNLEPLRKASETVGLFLNKGDIVIYESTVYPGVTEDECAPILQRVSELKLNVDFYVGYSPERINPGDKIHTVDKILKITSGSTSQASKKIDALYKSVVTAGTYLAPSIKVAEAAKIIENTQRDINIAFVNELAKIFNLLDINTQDVLKVAATKWNFLPFKPGLVGGHCISVDPYYLAQKAQEIGYHPEIILAGRRVNDNMGKYVASEVIRLMIKKDLKVKGATILILGITFKENCPDVRNTRVVDVISELNKYDTNITIYDSYAEPSDVITEYNLKIIQKLPKNKFDVVILAVAHDEFSQLNLRSLLKPNGVLYDVKGIVSKNIADGQL